MRRLWPGVVLAVALLVAVLLQVGLLAVLQLPGATPHLVLVLVAALAVARGPATGAIIGFAGGLLLDLAPPAAHAVGQWALVLTLAGYVAGQLGDPRLRPGTRLLLVGVLAGLATSAYVGVSGLLGAPWPSVGQWLQLAGTAALYAGLIATAVLPVGSWLGRRTAATARTAW